jgi:hypothetical protein
MAIFIMNNLLIQLPYPYFINLEDKAVKVKIGIPRGNVYHVTHRLLVHQTSVKRTFLLLENTARSNVSMKSNINIRYIIH